MNKAIGYDSEEQIHHLVDFSGELTNFGGAKQLLGGASPRRKKTNF